MRDSLGNIALALIYTITFVSCQPYPSEISSGFRVDIDNENIQYDTTGVLIFTFDASYNEDLPEAPTTFLSYNSYFSVDANKIGRHFYSTKTKEDELQNYTRYLRGYLENRVIEVHLGTPSKGFRWDDVLTKCSLAQVPTMLVNRTEFENARYALSRTYNTFIMEEAKYTLFYYGEYFMSPLTDCTFFGSIFLVRVLIPLRSMKSPNMLVSRFQSLAFTKNDGQGLQICFNDEFRNGKRFTRGLDPTVDLQHFLVNSIESPSDRVVANTPYIFYSTKIKSSSLDLHKRMTCPYVIERGTDADIVKYCPLICQNAEEYVFPIVQRTSEDTFHLVGNALDIGEYKTTVVIVCDSVTLHNVTIPVHGALKIKLPCPCDLVLRRPYPLRSEYYIPERSLRADGRDGCSETGSYSINNVRPIHWA